MSLAHWPESTSDDPESWLTECFQACCEQFGMKTGIISKVIDNRYIIRSAYSTRGDIFSPGMEFELQNTFYAAVINTQVVVSYLHVGKIPTMILHPVYVAVLLRSYIGILLFKMGKSMTHSMSLHLKSGKKHFSERDTTLIKLMDKKLNTFYIRNPELIVLKFIKLRSNLCLLRFEPH